MKKLIALAFCMVLALFFMMKPASFQGKTLDPTLQSEFLKALEDHLKSSVNYYYPNSAKIIDDIYFQGNVMKVLKTDDPKTEENEEKIEEYSSNITVAFIELEQQRDSMFIFKKADFYYYDLDKKEVLTSSQVFSNPEVKTFFDTYKDDINKKLSLFSEILLLFIISFLITVPILIMVFHNKGRSSIINIYLQE
ncbi:hypothetical protein [Cytobacillus dafuensis]|uniref:Uncharacterized protein n=1 Tax=Cytobacillus dafuensis TaxID=1742359 RepID=A0A5B8Z870_CYTDA|nr:hypothetical protein [Cytobacillus dafuensis]QED49147.1 hypothetical protein FSZ17_18870 [Cytobacillus dafuensis]